MNAATWVVAGSVASMLGAYAYQIIGGRTLGGAAFAPIGVLWTILYLVVSVVMPSIEAYVARSLVRGGDERSARRAVEPWILGTAVLLTTGCVLWGNTLFSGDRALGIAVAPLVVVYGYFVVVRGVLIGTDRYRMMGLVTGVESVARAVVVACMALVLDVTPALFAWTLSVGALMVVVWYAFDRRGRSVVAPPPPAAPATSAAFLAATSTVNGVAQILLAGGIVLLAPLGASATEISVAFVALTVARSPVAMGANGLFNLLLPPLVRQWETRQHLELRRTTALVAVGAIVSAAVGAAVAWTVGPMIIGALFGTAFVPTSPLIAVAVFGSVVLTGAMLLNQVLIAMGAERDLLGPWLLSIVTAAAAVAGTPFDAVGRVLAGLVCGAVVALVALVAIIGRHEQVADGRRATPTRPDAPERSP